MQAPRILAVCFAVGGVAFIAWGVWWSSDELLRVGGISLVVTGVVFLVVAGLMLVLAGRLKGARRANDDLTRTGIPGQARVLSIRETGISFHSGLEVLVGFELEVALPGRPPYPVALEQGVPRLLLGGVLPGSTVQVRVDPADPAKVAIDFSVAPTPGAGGFAGVAAPGAAGTPAAAAGIPPIGAVKSASELLATGTRGWATVVSVQDLGMTVAQTGKQPERPEWLDDRIYLFVLEVHLDGQAPFTAQMGQRVPDSLAGTIQPGMSLQVAVDPANPQQSVAIDWGGR